MTFVPELAPEAETPGVSYLSANELRNPQILDLISVAHKKNVANGVFESFVTFDVNPDPVAIIRTGDGHNKVIQRSERNDLFFIKNGPWFELVYQKSDIVASSLELFIQMEDGSTDKSQNPRRYAFFDIKGNFYDNARLADLRISVRQNGQRMTKHTAYFDIPQSDGSTERKEIPADDIYCIGGVRHFIPVHDNIYD